MFKQTGKISEKVGMTAYEVVANDYYGLKEIAIRETKRFSCNKNDLDEDIFHNVLLSLCEMFGESQFLMTLTQARGYFCNSFRNALNREAQYARNKYKTEELFGNCETKTQEHNIGNKIDYEKIRNGIKSKFSSNEYNLFMEFLSGTKLRELDEKYKITNSSYIVRKIKNYIKQEFSEMTQ